MTKLLLGTNTGVFRVDADSGEVRQDEGPPSVAYMARDAKKHYAVTREGVREAPKTLRGCRGELWEEVGVGRWQMVNKRPVEDEMWSFGADPKMEGRLYAGTAPALLHVSNDGGKTWKACESVRRIEGYETWTFPASASHLPH